MLFDGGDVKVDPHKGAPMSLFTTGPSQLDILCALSPRASGSTMVVD